MQTQAVVTNEVADVLSRYVPVPFGTNVLMDCGDWAVSYNAAPFAGFASLESDGRSSETAIVAHGNFYILNGDFRREYAELADAGGLVACLRFFAERPDLVSSWSAPVANALARCGGAA